jgi:hypothetical protein
MRLLSPVTYIRGKQAAHRNCLECEFMANETNTNMPDRPDPTPMDKRINPVPTEKERVDREADKLAHKGAEREHEFDNQQKPFTK